MYNNHLHNHLHNLPARHPLAVAPNPTHLHPSEPATRHLGPTTTDATSTPKRWPACTHNMYTMFNGIKKQECRQWLLFLPTSITNHAWATLSTLEDIHKSMGFSKRTRRRDMGVSRASLLLFNSLTKNGVHHPCCRVSANPNRCFRADGRGVC
jgi:hypothetical protein